MRTYFYGETTIENNQCLARNFWVFWYLDQEKAQREFYKLDIFYFKGHLKLFRQSLNYFFIFWFSFYISIYLDTVLILGILLLFNDVKYFLKTF